MRALLGKRRGVVIISALMLGALGSSSVVLGATPSAKPTITKTNDANHDGTFTASETVGKNATYPYTVTYRLEIFGGTAPGPNGPYHTIVSITDDKTGNNGTCAALVGTNINNNETKTCSYDVVFDKPSGEPVVNTATLTYDSGGNDVVSNQSTVTFEYKCNSGNGNGSDPIQFADPEAHCFGGDPGNAYNAGNKGGDEIPTSGGTANPGGNNVP